MTTPLTKPLKRELQIQGRPFVVTLTAEGIKLTLKGKRKGQELRWEDLVTGEAALAVALNASLKGIPKVGAATAAARTGIEADHPSAGESSAMPAAEVPQPNSTRRDPAADRGAKRKSGATAKRARSGRRR